MRLNPITATASLLLTLTLTACGSNEEPATDKPTATATTSAAATTPAATAADKQACVEAIANAITNRPNDFDPENDSDPKPTECAAIAENDYLDTYMEGLRLSNQRGRDELQRQIDEAASADAATP